MIDPRVLRDDPDRVRAAQAKRGLSDDVVDRALSADAVRRQAIADFEARRAEQKQMGKEVAQAQGEEKQQLLAQVKDLATEVKRLEAAQTEAEQAWHEAIMAIPNLAADEAPAGGEEDFVVLEHVGTPPEFDFEPRDHVELGRMLGAIDLERGAKVSGSRFYFLTGIGAQLELALVNMAMDQARAAGFLQVIPPSLVKPRAMEGTGFLGQAADEAPAGGEDDYVVLETIGTPAEFDFEPRDHVELGRMLGAIDLDRGAKVSGSRFYFLTGVGAELEFALINLANETARDHGFTQVIAPSMVKPRAMEGTGFLGQAADDVYRIEGQDMYLVGTSEVPMAAYHSDEILDGDSLPLRYAAFSPCFRKEAGSHGKDTKGIIRVHWFDKVEMFVYTTVEESYAEHQRLLEIEKTFLDKLELAYRVIDTAAGDLGLSAQRKFDCEAWIPTQGRYRELTSTSNCTEFQARRLDIRGRFAGDVKPVATLNGTLCAITRAIVAILETHQQADGSVRVPKALQPWLGGREVLEPVAR